jgi:uncharacterized protein YndB with AHSA1/START domain
MSTGLITNGERPAVRLERQLTDPPAVVWEAITDREQLRSWFPCDVDIEGGSWEVGASITFVFPAEVIEMTLTGEVLVVEAPKVLSFSWGDEVLRFELEDHDGGTFLVLIDELEPGHAARNAAGWEDCLDHLQGIDVDKDGWQRRFEAFSAAFADSLGPQEGPPAGYKG